MAMPFSLHEALQQIDPFVRLNDGRDVRTVEQLMFGTDGTDPAEYVLGVDENARLLIFRVGPRGFLESTPAFVEEKTRAFRPAGPLV